jgi:hypothetical protein
MEHAEWHVPGYGTENAGPFLRSLAQMTRPQKILEIGMGYTTPFLLDALKSNSSGLLWDSNCDKEYLNKAYNPKFVVVDDQSLENNEKQAEDRRNMLKEEPFVEFIEGDFTDTSVMNDVFSSGPYDLVWFDCGGPDEYEFFVDKYWKTVREYALFHFTYFRGKPNKNNNILSSITDYSYRMDLVEPHKLRQGSITMFRKTNQEVFTRGVLLPREELTKAYE